MSMIGGPPWVYHVQYYFAEIRSPVDKQNRDTTLKHVKAVSNKRSRVYTELNLHNAASN